MLSCRNLLSPTKVSPEKKQTRNEGKDEHGDIDELIDLTKSPGGDQELPESTGSQSSRTSLSSSGKAGGGFGADGSPVFRQKSLTFTEAATILLKTEKFGRMCQSIPQRPMQTLKASTFFMDLRDKTGWQVGDLTCDGYEPWDAGMKTASLYFRRCIYFIFPWFFFGPTAEGRRGPYGHEHCFFVTLISFSGTFLT